MQLWGGVGEQLKIAHTHTSLLAEHPAPTNELLLSTELQLGHTRSPDTAGSCVPALIPQALWGWDSTSTP